METKITHEELQDELEATLRAGLTPYVRSSPGVGKSDAAKQFAEKYDLEVIDIRLSQCMPEDLQGFPMLVNGKASFVPFSIFPIEGQELPLKLNAEGNSYTVKDPATGKMELARRRGWMLLLDELSSAPKATQAAAYKLILDRQVGSENLHSNCVMMACGNLATDKAVVSPMSTALQSRLIHYQLEVSLEDWLVWARSNNVDFRIQAFLQYKRQHLMNFKPDHKDVTYACPRTWGFLNSMILNQPIDRAKHTARVVGTVGHEAGMEFISFCKVMSKLPTWSSLIDPNRVDTIGVPNEASTKFATMCWAADKVEASTLNTVLRYIKKFDPDFQVIFCQNVVAKLPNIEISHEDFVKYAYDLMSVK